MLPKTKDKFIALNKKGLFPGPNEKEKAFLERVQALEEFFSKPPSEVDDFLTDGDWSAPREELLEKYDFSPDWIVAHFDNAKLPFFQAGATWISEKKTLRIPLIQLKKRYANKPGALSEIVAHEAVHAARMQFDEPRFEELLAYQTSRFPWRRFLGGLFMRSWESTLFLLSLLIPFVIELSLVFSPEGGNWEIFFWTPWVYLLYLLGRNLLNWGTLNRARRKLMRRYPALEKPWAVLLRLTDEEIWSLAWSSEKWKKEDLRKQLIWEIYFSRP